jgi:hypothetical protein
MKNIKCRSIDSDQSFESERKKFDSKTELEQKNAFILWGLKRKIHECGWNNLIKRERKFPFSCLNHSLMLLKGRS